MNEDAEMNKVVHAAFAEGAVVLPESLQAIRRYAGEVARRRHRWTVLRRVGIPFLLAASLAVAFVVRSSRTDEKAAEEGLRATIGLLCTLDGSEVELGEKGSGDLLMALQEAPCAELCEDSLGEENTL